MWAHAFIVLLAPYQLLLGHPWQHLVCLKQEETEDSVLVTIHDLLHFSPYFTFTPPYFLYDYLIPLVQGHMAIHAALSMTHRFYYYI